jgi:hypothetical protein
MRQNIRVIPAHKVIRDVPTQTIVETYYSFEDLTDDQQWNIAMQMVEWQLNADMQCEFEYIESLFPDSKIKWQWCDSGQGSGVNIYGTFSINDLLKYAGYDPIEHPFDITFEPNRWYTYSLWGSNRYHMYDGDIGEAVQQEYYDWLDEHGYFDGNQDVWADTFVTSWNGMIEDICDKMDELCTREYRYLDHLIYDWYRDPDCHDGEYYNADGTFAGYEWDLFPRR